MPSGADAPPPFPGHETLVLRAPRARPEAPFAPGAGNTRASLPDGGGELLGQRRGLERYARGGETMGVPLLHPWANRLSSETYTFGGRRVTLPSGSRWLGRDDDGLPIHG